MPAQSGSRWRLIGASPDRASFNRIEIPFVAWLKDQRSLPRHVLRVNEDTLIMPEDGAASAVRTVNPASKYQLKQIALSFLRVARSPSMEDSPG